MSGLASAALSRPGGRIGRCAVVGSSGVLLDGAALGKEIDGHDIVIRLNAAPVEGFEERVGHFTSVRMVNQPESTRLSQTLKQQQQSRRKKAQEVTLPPHICLLYTSPSPRDS